MPTLLLTALLGLFPFLFLFPDVLSVGGTFIRGDYLLLPFGALLLLHRLAFTERTLPFAGYSGGALAIMIGFPLLTLFQFLWIPEHIIDMEGAVKYALWPLKMVVWAVCMRELFVAHPNPLKAVYQVFATLVVLVFSLQVVELVSVPARLQMLEWYPIAAVDRVGQIMFRARAVFNGFDTASMFYLLATVLLTQLKTRLPVNKLAHAGLIMLCVLGALVSARTGALLIIGYLLAVLWNRGAPVRKLALAASVTWVVACVGLLGLDSVSGSEGSLLGRYLELMNVVSSGGDMLAVNSFWGTFEMNATALSDTAFNFWFGIGLNTSTTADQLYAKYLVMFGIVGLSLWLLVHLAMLAGLKAGGHSLNRDCLKWACLVYALLVAIAHIKGGNYFFAQRLGELTALAFMLAYSSDSFFGDAHAEHSIP